jgi:hypothetical protein
MFIHRPPKIKFCRLSIKGLKKLFCRFLFFFCFFLFFLFFFCFFLYSYHLHLPIGPLALTLSAVHEKLARRLGYHCLLLCLCRFGLSLLAKTAERRF